MLRCTNEKTNIKLQKTNKFQTPITKLENIKMWRRKTGKSEK